MVRCNICIICYADPEQTPGLLVYCGGAEGGKGRGDGDLVAEAGADGFFLAGGLGFEVAVGMSALLLSFLGEGEELTCLFL